MQEFDKIIELTKDSRVELGASFKELLHKELALGMTRYVCRNGTLSDGHEKITDAQRYYQAIKEMYTRACEMANYKVLAMEAQADLIDANDELVVANNGGKASNILRAEAKVLRASNRLRDSLVNAEDLMRQLDEFNAVRLELKEKVQSQYPQGIEQAEKDNWEAVAKYRMAKKGLGYQEQVTHIPLDKESKARLGLRHGSPEMALWLAVSKEKEIELEYKGNIVNYLESK